uniref:Tetratricopeptide repeat protein n=1 Tax=Eiseniibacteriota bacterium TaxID=2212470 RepID=A0A832ICB8_UNCEI
MTRRTPTLAAAGLLSLFALSAALPAASPAQPHAMTAVPEGENPPPLYHDLGSWTMPITASSPSVQAYFDQGLRLCYGFNHAEATRAFREAARRDPTCAMAWWGVAYAAGPNINMPMDDAARAVANEAIARAVALKAHVSPRERDFIDALATRYSTDPTAARAGLDSAYARAMKRLAQKYPDDADAAALHAEALLDLNPWNQWTHEGRPNPGTPALVAALERALARWPDHPGLNHFYIHTMEASTTPEKALAAARRLHDLVPGAGHLVHMPAHVYIRTGDWEQTVRTNEAAVRVDEAYIEQQRPEGIYPLMYYPHNVHFIWFGACMRGQSALAIEQGRKVAGLVGPDVVAAAPMVEFLPPVAFLTYVRFGRWADMLAVPRPGPGLPYTTAMWHYARGMALAATGDAAGAAAALDSLRAAARGFSVDHAIGTNTAPRLLRVASLVLSGESARRAKRWDVALRDLAAAAVAEDSLRFDEPPTWYYPSRHSLGAAQLEAGRAADAERTFRRELRRFPENGWSLYGLAAALRAQGKAREAEAVEARFRKAWERADVAIGASAF